MCSVRPVLRGLHRHASGKARTKCGRAVAFAVEACQAITVLHGRWRAGRASGSPRHVIGTDSVRVTGHPHVRGPAGHSIADFEERRRRGGADADVAVAGDDEASTLPPSMKLIEPLNAPPGETRAMLLMRYSWVLLLKPWNCAERAVLVVEEHAGVGVRAARRCSGPRAR